MRSVKKGGEGGATDQAGVSIWRIVPGKRESKESAYNINPEGKKKVDGGDIDPSMHE